MSKDCNTTSSFQVYKMENIVASTVPSDPRASQTMHTGATAWCTDNTSGNRPDNIPWCTDNTPPLVHDFTGTPGLTVSIPDTPLGFLQLFLTLDLLQYIVRETNLYAAQSLRNSSSKAGSLWVDVNVTDIAHYLGLSMLMGIVKSPSIEMYWQTREKWHVPTFSNCMTSKRYKIIAKYFHTYNNVAIEDNRDRLIKVRTVMEYFANKFKTYYIPDKHLCLDEGSMPWRGRLCFKVNNPNKPDKSGVKLYMLAEAKTGYIFSFEIYSGIGKTTIETVMGLIEPLKYKGYHLYMDNYYNSVNLTEQLLQQGVYTCGTLRLERGAPKELQLIAKKKMPDDTTVFRRKGNTFIVLWKGKGVVSLITNCHNADTQEVQQIKQARNRDKTNSIQRVTVNKPKAICDYNSHIKGVDHFNQMIQYYHFTRRSQKWTKKMTFYLLEMAIFNAFALHKKFTPDDKKLSLLQFHKLIIDALIDFAPEQWPLQNDNIIHAADTPTHSTSTDVTPASPSNMPGPSGVKRALFSAPLPQEEDSSVDETNAHATTSRRPRILDKIVRLNRHMDHSLYIMGSRQRCHVCYKSGRKRNTTKYKCRVCDVAMCPSPCHGLYHRKTKYWEVKQ